MLILTTIVGGGIFYQWQALKKEIKILKVKTPETIIKKEMPKLTLEAIKNTEYYIPTTRERVQLTNGYYKKKRNQGSGFFLFTAEIFSDEKIAFGDLNYDGLEDAAVIYYSTHGGTGTYFNLGVVINKNGKPYNLDSEPLGDRVIVNSVTIQARRRNYSRYGYSCAWR